MTSFRDRYKAKQLLDFEGIRFGNIRPTDIDLAMDFQGQLFIFAEIKTEGAYLTAGQKYHLQALVKGLRDGGRKAYALVAYHNVNNARNDVIVKDCTGVRVYDGVQWSNLGGTLGEAIEMLKGSKFHESES